MPHLKELYERHRDQGLVLIGVHSDPKAEEMKKAVSEWGITWPVAHDADRSVMKAFQCDSYPDYCLIDRNGVVRFCDLANGEVDKAVQLLLQEKPGE